MPWVRGQPSNPKYRTKAHRMERAKYVQQMERTGYLVCAQPMCVMPTRIIQAGQAWHLGHDDTGTQYIGPTHAYCNVRDGAKRARSRQDRPQRWPL